MTEGRAEEAKAERGYRGETPISHQTFKSYYLITTHTYLGDKK